MAPQNLLSSSPPDGTLSGSIPCSEHVDRPHVIFPATMENLQPNVLHAPNRRLPDAQPDDFLKNLLVSEDHQDFTVEPQMSLMPTTQAVSDGDWKNVQRESLDWVHSHRLPQPLVCKTEDAEGEVTLEDFVRKTGICKEDGRLNYVSPVLSNSTAAELDVCSPVAGPDLAASTAENTIPDIHLDWMKFVNRQAEHLMQQTLVKNELPSSSFLGGGANIYDNFGDSPNYCPNNLSQGFSFPFPNLVETPDISEFGMLCKKRPAAESIIEKIVERRQRRMIKNRESAARSRARKQAYTFELEAEVTYLKEENARLRQEQASRVQPLGSCESKIQVLRRTRTW